MKGTIKMLRSLLGVVALTAMEYCLPAAADTYVVKNTNNNGPGSLRQMINVANAHDGKDTIAFNIPGVGGHTIAVESELPEITDPVIIDGYTQPGSSANTRKTGNNAVLLIRLSGANVAPGTTGLFISGGQSIVRGLVINKFGSRIITSPDGSRSYRIGNGILITGKGGNRIEGCFIGTNRTGSEAAGNGYGVYIGGSPNNIVGGVAARSRNIISGNDATGVFIYDYYSHGPGNRIRGNYIGTDATGQKALGHGTVDSPRAGAGVYIEYGSNTTVGGTIAGAGNVISGNNMGVVLDGFPIPGDPQPGPTGHKIEGNYIGVDATGTRAVGNGGGIWIGSRGTNNTIGGTTAGARNVISGNHTGILMNVGVPHPDTDVTVQGNYIGTDVTGSFGLGNTGAGIAISFASGNLIGGTEPGAGNLIAFNESGVHIFGYDYDGEGYGIRNAILSNSIHSNNSLGIDLDEFGVTPNDVGDGDIGGNNLQNFPVLNTASTTSTGTTVQGRLQSTPDTTFTLQFFANSACDPSGSGEGERFIGSRTVTTSAEGRVRFRMELPPLAAGQYITATATDSNNNTSEFSACVAVTEVPSTAAL